METDLRTNKERRWSWAAHGIHARCTPTSGSVQAHRPHGTSGRGLTVVVSKRGLLSLGERLQLLANAFSDIRVVVANDARGAWRQINRRDVPYLLDINAVTAPIAVRCGISGRAYVLDTGDDVGQLARASGSRRKAHLYEAAERAALARASAVVCRGSVHVPVLRAKTQCPIHWAPDTVEDALLDSKPPTLREDLIATFGFARRPASGDRAYGWEVIDVLKQLRDAAGLIVASGPGASALRARAARLGVNERVSIFGALRFDDLLKTIAPAGFVTSVQSDDLAGWVRTTGKLPISLAMGKAVVTTRVGEAWRLLPQEFLVAPGPDQGIVEDMAAIVRRGIPPGWPERAQGLAEEFRRSRVAKSLQGFLAGL